MVLGEMTKAEGLHPMQGFASACHKTVLTKM